MQKLQGKVVIITGSTKGIGKAIAKRFVDEGAKVVITSSSQRNVDNAVKEFPGQNAFGMACDVTNYDDVEKLISETVKRFGHLDVIINNAGVAEPFRRIVDAPLEDWYKPIDINIKGSYHCCRAALKYFLTQGKGKVINMAGAGTTTNTPYFSGYGSSKAALYRMTMALSEEYKGTGIEVMLLNPGLVRTEILSVDRPTLDLQKRMETFSKVMDMFAQPPSVAAGLAVKLAGSWSDGKPGVYLNALSKTRARKLLITYPFKKMLNKIDRTVY
ncbi:MAG: SDR family oxidoreductase [Chlorobiales bacterium]|nr:SDR family oxidoreductase [Chlorobiales bacterium]